VTFEESYRAAMEGAAAFDRSHRGALRVTGADRESFLQNMLTNDVRSLSPFRGVLAAFLSNKGKLVSDMLVFKLPDSFLLECEAERVEPLRKALDRYVISEDVRLERLLERETSFSLEGPKAAEILAEVSGADVDVLEHFQSLMVEIDAMPALVFAQRNEPSPRFDVRSSVDHAGRILDKVLAKGAIRGDELAAEARRIEAGRFRFGVDMGEDHIPQEASLEEALSFQKGCYIGQEVVVRLAHRGHVNRKLVGLEVSGSKPERGANVLVGDAEVGSVTSSTESPGFGFPLALAYVKREFFEPGTRVSLSNGAEGVVSSLPFTGSG
jgi:folate-binding protein YgfZ